MLPDRDTCAQLASEGYNLIPVARRLVADELTPVGALARLQDEEYAFLFESVVGGERLARYSMLGASPRERLVGDLGQVRLVRRDGSEQVLPGDPYAAVRTYMAGFRSPHLNELPRFCGGLVGYFSYDTVRLVEDLPNMPPDDLNLPDLLLMRFDTVAVFDHSFNHLLLITHLDLTAGADVDTAWAVAEAELDALQARLSVPYPSSVVAPQACPDLAYRAHTKREDFEAAVETIKEYIRAGDIFQAVPSQRLSADVDVSPFQVYRSVRSLNPSPYMFCLRMGEASLVGASPEIMVRVEAGKVVVRPIAGTIHRGATPAEDAELAAQLLADPKERAEHVMLIDLGRNDAGRVSEPGSVELLEEMVIERYSHVQHIVSHVEGRLREGLDALDALRCCHPAGTVSGAPKIRAMEIIDQLEPVKRGPYAGAVGYLDFRGNLDTCIALRTAVLTPGQAHVQAGAGVVADSVPAKEFQETLNKAQAMLQAIARAGQF
ncbi:MAG: anthranilate synthase component I [Planctomycetota bacterium]|jgi:anthranilate synthase component 1|nr:anthranilate synthase component I [Planctomycetota bacterium]